MTNHVHHLVVPHEKDSLRWTFQMTHKRYAEYVNARKNWTGHLWQAKFFSIPVDESYFLGALRYIYRNTVEATGVFSGAGNYLFNSGIWKCVHMLVRALALHGAL